MSITTTQSAKMDRMYRYQRFFYDLTRKYYLLGRDVLIREMDVQPGDRVLEMGCGTARNLIKLAKAHPQAQFYGIDASAEMLKTAEKQIARHKLEEQVHLVPALAEEVNYNWTFFLNQPWDKVFFSYSLSMIPTWREAIQAAIDNLKIGGEIHMVDFWDQKDLPRWFAKVLTKWLSWFHVRHEPLLIDHLEQCTEFGYQGVKIRSLYGRYAFYAQMTRCK